MEYKNLHLKGRPEVIDFIPVHRINGVWFFTVSPGFNESGQIVGAVETIIDISE